MLCVALSVTASFEGDKVLIAAVIFVLTLFGTYIPWLLNAACYRRHHLLRERVMNVLSCLAGGVILGAGFTHILPDAVDAWGEYYASRGDDPDTLYPMAYAVALGTLLFLWAVDRIWGHSGGGHGHSHGHHHGPNAHPHSHAPASSHDHHHHHNGGYGTNSTPSTSPPDAAAGHHRTPSGSAADPKTNGAHNGNGHAHNGHSHGSANGNSGNGDAVIAIAPATSAIGSGSGMSGDDIALDGVARTAAERDAAVYDSNYFEPAAADGGNGHGAHPHAHEHDGALALARAEKRRHAYVLCAAMTFHAVCDGLALGTESDEDRKFFAVLLAVAVHKWLDGMAVGVPVFAAFMQPRPQWFVIVPVCVFTSLMTPLGIFIGMSWGGEPVSKAILLSISAGSFIFIPLIEMIPLGIDDGKRVPFKFFVVAVGATAMAILAAWS